MNKIKTKIFAVFVALIFCANISLARIDIVVPAPEDRNKMFSYELYGTGEYHPGGQVSVDNFSPDIINAICAGSYEWNTFINNSNQTIPVLIPVSRINEENAYASGEPVDVYTDETKTVKEEYKRTALNAVINGKYFELNDEQKRMYNDYGKVYDGAMYIGLPLGASNNSSFYTDTSKLALYQSSDDYIMNTVQHELGHALGIISFADRYINGYSLIFFSKPFINYYGKIDKEKSDRISVWDRYLRIYDGIKEIAADKGMIVLVDSRINIEDLGVNKDYVFDVSRNAPYFVGPKAMQTLSGVSDAEIAGKTEEEIISYCQDKITEKGGLISYSVQYTNPLIEDPIKVNGLPIHPFDSPTSSDLSHIELKNSYMSHQNYRNWTTFMEAELSAIADIGYDINLKDYFGKSYYLDGITDTLEGNFNFEKGYAVGTHIYGSNDNIIQTGSVTSSGDGSFGARIDGIEDEYVLQDAAITVTGNNSIGLGVTYGKGHNVTIDADSSVIATGQNSIAVSFDFGKNVLSESLGQKGSFINNDGDSDVELEDNFISNEINGALVENLNVYGTVTASGNTSTAIFISENAYVKNININRGSVITGDIISKWNSVYGGKFAKVQTILNLITDLNFNNYSYDGKTFAGNINGLSEFDDDISFYNTLRMNVDGNLFLDGSSISVYQINNEGTIDIQNSVNLSTLNETQSVTGEGNITVNGTLNLDSTVKLIENTIDLKNNSMLSVLNGVVNDTSIKDITSEGNSYLAFDFGDTFTVNTDNTANLNISQIKVNEEKVKTLEDGLSYQLFKDKSVGLNGLSNVYYNNNKYSLSCNDKNLTVHLEGSGFGLQDAISDITTLNYIVAEDEKQTSDDLRVTNSYFEISGEDLNFDLHKGLVIDKATNGNEETVIKTNVYGACDTDLKVSGGGKLTIDSSEQDISIGIKDFAAITLEGNSTVDLKSNENSITVLGDIVGESTNDILLLSGKKIALNNVDPLTVKSQSENVFLQGVSKGVVWNLEEGSLSVTEDENLSSDGTNEIQFNGGNLSLVNNKASSVKLAKMDVSRPTTVEIDVDLKEKTADTFAFDSPDDILLNGGTILLSPNMLNLKTALTDKEIIIPFTSEENNNQKLMQILYVENGEITTPIYKYYLGAQYNFDENYFNFFLSRFNSSSYKDFNPSVLVAPVATQVGSYLTQINSYETVFNNVNLNKISDKQNGIWVKPYGTKEDVKLKNDLKVENTQYGSYFGYDSNINELSNDWNMMFSVYGGYIGAKQSFEKQSVSQNGGHIGLAGYFYKNKFFTGVTVNFGASNSSADTMYGHENFVTLLSGIASKTSYDFNVSKSFIFQPSLLMSYSYIKTLDYTNGADVDIESSPLSVLQVAPELKFIVQLHNSWQPYMNLQMVWNMFDETRFTANKATLPNFELDSYISYGVGVQKSFGENFTGYVQVDLRDSGREGVNGKLGIKYKI